MIGIDCISPLRMICLLAAATVISASLAWLGFDRLAEERESGNAEHQACFQNGTMRLAQPGANTACE